MATTTIPIGRPFTLTSAVIYALPQRALKFTSQGAGTIQTSNDGVTFAAPTADNLAAAFIRANAGDAIITIV
jgi:hypothetical protein